MFSFAFAMENSSSIKLSDKQEHILLEAEKLFAEKSFAGTSVRDIAQAAGVNLAMINYYFGSKEKLLASIFEYRIAANRIMLRNLVEDVTISSAQKIVLIIENYINKMMHNRCFHQIVSKETAVKEIPELKASLMETKLQNLALVKKIIAEGQANGSFRQDIDANYLMANIIGTIYYGNANVDWLRTCYNMPNATDEAVYTALADLLRKNLVETALLYLSNKTI